MRIWMVGVFSLVLATAGFSQDDWTTHGGDTAPKLIAFGLPS